MNERFPKDFPADTRRVLRAAKDVGYEQDERLALVREPERVLKDKLDPSLARNLGPKTIENLLAKLGGKDMPSRTIVELGNALYDMLRFFEANGQRAIHPDEQKIIGVGVKLVEESLYVGTLAKLHGKNAAELAFLINRVAKLKSLPESQQTIAGFLPERFHDFVDDVETFANGYLSDEVFERRLNDARERRMRCEDALASDPTARAYIQTENLAEAASSRVNEERARIGNAEYMRLAVEDIRARLQTAMEIFGGIYTPSSDPKTEKLERLIGNFYRSLTDERAPARAANSVLTDMRTTAPTMISVIRETPDNFGSQWAADTDLKNALSEYLVSNLRSFREKHLNGIKTSSGAKTDGWGRTQADRITDDLLSVATDISGKTGPLARLRSLISEEETVKTKRLRQWEALSARSVERNAALNAWIQAKHEETRIEQMRARLPDERTRVARSLQAVRHDTRSKRATDLYVAKTLLIAADMRTRTLTAHPNRRYLPNDRTAQTQIDVYRFEKPEERKNQWGGDNEKPKQTYADVHFQVDYLPLAEMAVLMQTE